MRCNPVCQKNVHQALVERQITFAASSHGFLTWLSCMCNNLDKFKWNYRDTYVENTYRTPIEKYWACIFLNILLHLEMLSVSSLILSKNISSSSISRAVELFSSVAKPIVFQSKQKCANESSPNKLWPLPLTTTKESVFLITITDINWNFSTYCNWFSSVGGKTNWCLFNWHLWKQRVIGFFRYDGNCCSSIDLWFPWTSSLTVVVCDDLPSTLSIARAGSESASDSVVCSVYPFSWFRLGFL